MRSSERKEKELNILGEQNKEGQTINQNWKAELQKKMDKQKKTMN